MILGHAFAKTKSSTNILKECTSSRVKENLKDFCSSIFEALWLSVVFLVLYLRLKILDTSLSRLKLRLDRLSLLAQCQKPVADCSSIKSGAILDQRVNRCYQGHTRPLNQALKSQSNHIIFRQSLNLILCVIPCQNATVTEKLWSKLRRLPNPSLSKARNFSNLQTLNVSYARQKKLRRANLKPLGKQPVKQTGEIGFAFLCAINVLLCERDRVGRLSHRLPPSAFSLPASGFHLKKYVSFLLTRLESIRSLSNSQSYVMANKRLSKEKQA